MDSKKRPLAIRKLVNWTECVLLDASVSLMMEDLFKAVGQLTALGAYCTHCDETV